MRGPTAVKLALNSSNLGNRIKTLLSKVPTAPSETTVRTFTGLAAKLSIQTWRRDYNEERPHSSLGNLTPAEFIFNYNQQKDAEQPEIGH